MTQPPAIEYRGVTYLSLREAGKRIETTGSEVRRRYESGEFKGKGFDGYLYVSEGSLTDKEQRKGWIRNLVNRLWEDPNFAARLFHDV
ncbi:MAG: hypothetical protein HYW25_05740 [Candidatus Aenigmarchaeota archaeon]|nr:hypothetical protein [Candidatus Aenigmarchaeota archaeon]